MKSFRYYFILIFFISSCGNSNFFKQKYTDLKAPPIKKTASVSKESKDDISEFPSSEKHETEDKEECLEKNGVHSYQNELSSNSTDDFILMDEDKSHVKENSEISEGQEESTEDNTHSAPTEIEKLLDEERDIQAENYNTFILAMLITATVCLAIAGICITLAFDVVAFAEIAIYIAIGFSILAMVAGLLAFINAMKLRKIKEKSKETVYMYFGIIGGWVLVGGGLIQLINAFFAWLFL